MKWILLEQTTRPFNQVWSVPQGAFPSGYSLCIALGQQPPTVVIHTWATHTPQLVRKRLSPCKKTAPSKGDCLYVSASQHLWLSSVFSLVIFIKGKWHTLS